MRRSIHPLFLAAPQTNLTFSLSASRQLIRLARSHGPICQLAGWATQSRGGLDFKLSAFDNMGNFRIRLHAHNSQQVRIRISPLIRRNCFLKLAQILQLERVEESMAATSAACTLNLYTATGATWGHRDRCRIRSECVGCGRIKATSVGYLGTSMG